MKVVYFTGSARGRTFTTTWGEDLSAKDIVVFVHGLGEHLGRYSAWADRFVKEGIKFYAMDLHGHGRTEGPRGHCDSFELIYNDISELLTRAQSENPGARIHLYGHSMGGCIVLGFDQSRQPKIASIIVTGPAIKPGFEPPRWKVALGKKLEAFLPRLALSNELDVQGISTNPAVMAAYLSDPLVHNRISVRWFNEWLRAVDKIEQSSNLFKNKMLFMHGGSDRLTSATATEKLARSIGSSVQFKLWPSAFHELHHEPCQNDVFSAVMSFINSIR